MVLAVLTILLSFQILELPLLGTPGEGRGEGQKRSAASIQREPLAPNWKTLLQLVYPSRLPIQSQYVNMAVLPHRPDQLAVRINHQPHRVVESPLATDRAPSPDGEPSVLRAIVSQPFVAAVRHAGTDEHHILLRQVDSFVRDESRCGRVTGCVQPFRFAGGDVVGHDVSFRLPTRCAEQQQTIRC